MKTCKFNRAWIGNCKNPVVGAVESDDPFIDDTHEGDFCEKHQGIKCKCGNQAVRECSDTLGPMVCGAPLCKTCRCNFKGIGY